MQKLETPENLVVFMKDQNIKFENISEKEAIDFLNNNTYYKKISSYKNNFDYYIKNVSGSGFWIFDRIVNFRYGVSISGFTNVFKC